MTSIVRAQHFTSHGLLVLQKHSTIFFTRPHYVSDYDKYSKILRKVTLLSVIAETNVCKHDLLLVGVNLVISWPDNGSAMGTGLGTCNMRIATVCANYATSLLFFTRFPHVFAVYSLT